MKRSLMAQAVLELASSACEVGECLTAHHPICVCACHGAGHGQALSPGLRPKKVVWTPPTRRGPGPKRVIHVRGPRPPAAPPSTPLSPGAKPDEKNVSELVNPSGNMSDEHAAALDEALSAIDKVHHDGTMNPVKIDSGVGDEGVAGEYTPFPWGGEIMLSTETSPHPALTAAHELGHYIDFEGLGGGWDHASTSRKRNSAMDKWYKTVMASQPIYDMQHVHVANRQARAYFKSYVKYATRPEELWARSYSQYIAVKSRNPTMLADLKNAQFADLGTPVRSQWSTTEFAPIADAVENVLRERGWLNE